MDGADIKFKFKKIEDEEYNEVLQFSAKKMTKKLSFIDASLIILYRRLNAIEIATFDKEILKLSR